MGRSLIGMAKGPGRALALALVLAGLVAPAAGWAQDAAAGAPPPAASETIVVLGEVPVDELPTQTDTPVGRAYDSRSLASDASMFVRCAKRPKRNSALSAILDHGPNDRLAQRALHRFVVSQTACYPGFPLPPLPKSPYFGACNGQLSGLCRNTFDRGALFEVALAAYADGYELTRKQTFDRAIRTRFGLRQRARNELSTKLDREYFDTVACFIQVSPDWGRRLLEAEPGSDAETRARQYLIGLGSACVGGATEVKADPSQFRAYAADALYNWIAAAQGRRTLVR